MTNKPLFASGPNRSDFEVRHAADMESNTKWVEVDLPGAQSTLVIYPKTIMQDWAERKPSIVFQCGDIDTT